MTRYLLLVLMAAGLSACGFHLRGSDYSPLSSAKVVIAGLPTNDLLLGPLTIALTRAGATVLASATDDALVLKIIGAAQSMRPISLNRTGLAREFDLGYTVTYEIKDAKGEVIEPPQKLKLNREQYNDQFLIMGRSEEEAQMRLEMREEAADTLVRRLSFLLKDKAAGAGRDKGDAPQDN